jgi:hypothetical protein
MMASSLSRDSTGVQLAHPDDIDQLGQLLYHLLQDIPVPLNGNGHAGIIRIVGSPYREAIDIK